MARKFKEEKLVIASHNEGKVREIRELLSGFKIEIVSAAELGLPEPDETGTTFIENSQIKARAATEASGLPALADDSGFCIWALDGKPGVESARWAGPNKDFSVAMKRIHEMMQDPEAREDGPAAWFACALTMAWPDGHVETFEGTVDGAFVWPPRGDQGFGYGPIFQPKGEDRTFGEMPAPEKHSWSPGKDPSLSHRARAFNLLVISCLS